MKVLVVDDDVVSRMMLMHLVDACAPCEILEAEDGEDAWRLLADGLRPDIVFSDLRMPRLDGLALLARLRADPALAATPFVLVSAASDAGTLEQAGRLGASGCLAKPFAHAQVRAVMAGLAPAREDAGADSGEDADEEPQEVARRLGITLERLLVYLGGLARQLEDARGLERPPAARLVEGCLTLGLSGSAMRLRAAGDGDRAALQAAIGQALEAVRRQEALARKAAADSAC